MKHFMVSVLAVIAFSPITTAQTKGYFDSFSVATTENIAWNHAAATMFFEATNFRTANKDVLLNTNNTQLLTLQNGYQVLKFDILHHHDFTILYAIINTEKKEFIWYFLNNTPIKIELLSSDRIRLLTITPVNNTVSLTLNTTQSNAFLDCLKAVEEDFKATISGYLSWETNPLPAVIAAVSCRGCVKKWWACPPAYEASLQNKAYEKL